MFHFSVIVIQEVLKALATSVGSIYFSLFTVMWEPVLLTVLSLYFCWIHLFFIIHSYVGTCSTDCTFPVSLFECSMLFLFCYYILLYSTVV